MTTSFSLRRKQLSPINGVKDKDATVCAFTNATIRISASNVVENATLLVQEGRVIGVGSGLAVPKGAVVSDLDGKHIYPSLMESTYSTYGIKQPEKPKDRKPGPQYDAKKHLVLLLGMMR